MEIWSTNSNNSDQDTDYDSGVSIGGLEEVEEIERLLRERLEDKTQHWKLGFSSVGGRGVIATKSIEPGQIIFSDTPIVIGPRGVIEGSAVCVSCLKSGLVLKPCSKGCRLPVCSSACQETHSSTSECELLLELGVQKGEFWSPQIYRALTPFRCLVLSNDDKQLMKMLQPYQPSNRSNEVNLLAECLEQDLPLHYKSWMNFCCQVLDTFSFQVVSDELEHQHSSLRGIYPLAGLMNHSCMPNTRQVFDSDNKINVIAVKPIASGEEILISYCPLLWPTPLRINFLLKTKHFICSCSRCADPTEFGTNLSGLRCSCGGMILPQDPLEPKSTWKCSNCCKYLSSNQAMIAGTLLFNNPDKARKSLSLHNSHYLVLDAAIKNILSQKSKQCLKGVELDDRKNRIKHILEILERLELGECRTKGLLLNGLNSMAMEK